MNRIYQGRVTRVENLDGKPFEEWSKKLWEHHNLFQDNVNYYLLALASVAPAKEPIETWLKALFKFREEVRQRWDSAENKRGEFPGPRERLAKHLNLKKDEATFERCVQEVIGNTSDEDARLLHWSLYELMEEMHGAADNAARNAAPGFLPRFADPAFDSSFLWSPSAETRDQERAELQRVLYLPSPLSLAFLRAALDEGEKQPTETKNDARLRNPFDDDPIRLARKRRGYVFRPFTRLPSWAGADEFDRLAEAVRKKPGGKYAESYSAWAQYDIAAFKEALTSALQFYRGQETRDDEVEDLKEAKNAYEGAGRKGMGGDDGQQLIPAFFLHANRVYQVKATDRIDVTKQVQFGEQDVGHLILIRCLCGADLRGSAPLVLSTNANNPTSCPKCKARLFFANDFENRDDRIVRIQEILRGLADDLTEDNEDLDPNQIEYGLRDRSLRHYAPLRDAWNEDLESVKVAPGQPIPFAVLRDLREKLSEFQTKHRDDFGDARLFRELLRKQNQIIWRDEKPEQRKLREKLMHSENPLRDYQLYCDVRRDFPTLARNSWTSFPR